MAEFLQLMENWDGYIPASLMRIDEAAAARFIDLMANTGRLFPHRQEYLLRETIMADDFPALFGFTLERDMLARYRAAVPDWRSYCAVGTLPNFNTGQLHKVMGNDNLLPRVTEKGEYLVGPVSAAYYNRRVYKYGRQFDISWEALVNDVLNAFGDIPARMADAVVYTRAYNVTDLFASAAGPDVGLFGAPIVDIDGQVITNLGALPLTIANLQTTFNLMAMQTDVNGRPLGIAGIHLVVPPALRFTALGIKHSITVAYAATAIAATPLPTTNILALPEIGLQVHINPLLPVIDTSANRNGTWYLFADLSQGKAIQMDFLRGYEDPDICMKSSDKVAVGSAAPQSPFSGDFTTDNVLSRVRDVHGGVRLDPRYVYAQVST